ncbi:substrate-binding domain-containing protein [Ornithinibacillus salinisoli]|uniref:Substrate-binding domain-containing protein n=1 Tax=Ornithinibacillus salinisoli TaxID=1848459 RepID=A0ABW4VWP4_9BACI
MLGIYFGIAFIIVLLLVIIAAFSKNKNIWFKVLGFFVACLLIIFVAFFAIVITLLMGEVKFYPQFIIGVTIGILFFLCNGFFRFLKPRMLKISVISFIALCVIAVIGNQGYEAYVKSVTMDNQEVDLTEYEPFVAGSKVATLDEPASFKMEGELPRLDGATALYPLYAAFVQATYPEKNYDVYNNSEVMSRKTPNAYNNLINGDVDIIFVAGPSSRQINKAEQQGVELNMTPIGREAFVFFVHAKNPVEGLTTQELKDIYAGKITNWSDVGGKNESIRAFQRPDDSGSQTALENFMENTPLMEPPTDDVVTGMGGIISETADYRNYKNAIGYSFRFFSMDMVQNNAIRHLEIDGVFPNKDTIRNGEYPIASEFYAITAGSENPNVDAFLEWILSEEGQELVEKTGYVPVSESE